jgi:hypothetical protein
MRHRMSSYVIGKKEKVGANVTGTEDILPRKKKNTEKCVNLQF